MDAAGAESLRQRLEQQKHWRQAPAVCDGRQPAIDPDLADLAEVRDGLRIYGAHDDQDGSRRMCKRLVDGLWRVEVIDLYDDQPDGRAGTGQAVAVRAMSAA